MAELGWYDKALECMEKENYAQAKEYLEKALEEGEIEAYCDLGNRYFEGRTLLHGQFGYVLFLGTRRRYRYPEVCFLY